MEQLLRNVRFVDVLDVALVATFFYVLLTWLRRSLSRGTSRRALAALVLFAAVYFAARVLGLYLVRTITEVFFVVFLLAAVVVFQADIRRMVDRIGTWNLLWRPSRTAASATPVDTLVEAAAKMADRRTGALIALKGQEPWDRQIEGGVPLNGAVTEPLLYSLFNPTSPGHDGAVLVEGDRITRFATHLTLSKNLQEVGRHGTRHTAALGLAEHCDALVIVVSEESGRISVAQNGRLTELDSAGDLKKRLEQFWQQHYTDDTAPRPPWWRRGGVQRALLSVTLALLLWFAFAYRPTTVQRTFVVPIVFRNLPPSLGLEEPIPLEARVTLSGSEQAFRLLDPAGLALSLNLEELEAGVSQIALGEDQLDLPSGISLSQVEPRTVRLEAQRMQPVEVAIRPRTTGSLPDSLELVALIPSPAHITLRAPAAADPPATIPTEPIELDTIMESTQVETRLILPPGLRLPPEQDIGVTVRVQVRARQQAAQTSGDV